MSNLVPPHGKDQVLKPLLLNGKPLEEEQQKAQDLKQIEITSREAGDAIMMGIGGFTPLEGFMGSADWKSVCTKMMLTDGTFWPIPVTVSVSQEDADEISLGDEITLVEDGVVHATMMVDEK
jgi:sulfate adenylyltransferase